MRQSYNKGVKLFNEVFVNFFHGRFYNSYQKKKNHLWQGFELAEKFIRGPWEKKSDENITFFYHAGPNEIM